MGLVEKFINKKTLSFASKKTQKYTLFSFVFKLIENKVDVDSDIVKNFESFVLAYNLFKNSVEIDFEDEYEKNIFNEIKKYKLASSEGINKIGNRVIRFQILEKFCSSNTDLFLKSCNRIIDKLSRLESFDALDDIIEFEEE